MKYQIAIGNPRIEGKHYTYDVHVITDENEPSLPLAKGLTLGAMLYKMGQAGWNFKGSYHDMLIWQKAVE